jgi:DNA-binding beta-propeller fold protein YncE
MKEIRSMKYLCIVFLVASLLISACNTPKHGVIEWGKTTIALEAPPRDVAFSSNDKWLFVLNDNGEVLVYARGGKLQERVRVGILSDQIKVGPAGSIMYLSNRKNDDVEVIELDPIQKIRTVGSPFKGPADAPVVIALFGDFQ